jgi:uncharacterized membrane protein
MHWDLYTTFAVIGGVVLVAAGVLGGEPPKEKLLSIAVGIGMAGYGIFVSTRTSGTWPFPIAVFVIPFALVAKAIWAAIKKSNDGQPTNR